MEKSGTDSETIAGSEYMPSKAEKLPKLFWSVIDEMV